MSKIEIKSSLLNDPAFKFVKQSLIDASLEDGKDKFRVKVVEYINDSSSESSDVFFYDMLEYIRFRDYDNPEKLKESTAYTKPDKRVYLNCPSGGSNPIGENVRWWDFIYDHECLHQLWDTFGVAKKIMDNKIEYNHDVLNIASDCVINDYLSYYRKKPTPNNLVTPEWLKEKFGVEYNRKEDTQYTLYLKLMKSPKKKEIEQAAKEKEEEWGGKIKPKSVKNQPPTGGGGKDLKFPEDYVKGYKEAIHDVIDKKVDPSKFQPSDEWIKKYPEHLDDLQNGNVDKFNHEDGYNDAMIEIKEGIEKGIVKSESNGNGGNSNLPQIPWEDENMPKPSGKSDEKDKNQKDNGEGGENENSDIDDMSGDEAADDAKKSASKAKEAADRAKKAAEEKDGEGESSKDGKDKDGNGSSDSGKEDNKDGASKAKEAADMAKKLADKAEKLAKEAEEAASDGDEEKAKEKAKEAREAAKDAETEADRAEGKMEGSDTGSKGEGGEGAGKGHIEGIETPADLEKIKQGAEEVINKWKNKISGDLGKFIRQCKRSVELNQSGLKESTVQAAPSWNIEAGRYINTYVKKKVFQKKRQFEKTYSKIKRGKVIHYGDPIIPGKRIRKNGLTINVAFYLDRSGSMGSCLDKCFDASYKIAESLKKQYAKERVVDEITFKMFAFDDYFSPVKWGNRMSLGGGTMQFPKLLSGIADRTNDHLVNVIITDAQFPTIDETGVKKFLREINGMVLFVTNHDNPQIKKISKEEEFKTELFYVLADSNFTVK